MITVDKLLKVTFYASVITCYFKSVESARILVISPIPGLSHWNFMTGINNALIDRGHHVTVLTPFLNGNRDNYTEIDVTKEITKSLRLDISFIRKSFTSTSDLIGFLYKQGRDNCKTVYKNEVIKNLIADPTSNFDIIYAAAGVSECVSYLSSKLNAPLVFITSPPLIPWFERTILGHYPNPAVVSHLMAPYCIPRTLIERFTNTIWTMYTSCLLRYNTWFTNRFDRQFFDMSEPVKPSLTFANTDCTADPSRPQLSSVIPIGGIHLRPPKKIPEVR